MTPGADLVKVCPECGRETTVRCKLGGDFWVCEECFRTRIPPGHPRAPKYWRNEQGGLLGAAVDRLINQKPLFPSDIVLIRVYLRQWIDSPVWDANPYYTDDEARAALAELRRTVRGIQTVQDIQAWLRAALREHMDPL